MMNTLKKYIKSKVYRYKSYHISANILLRIYVLGPSGIGKTYSINRLTKSLGLLKKWNQYNFKDSRIIDKDLESIYQLILQNAPFNLSKLRRQSIRLNQKVYNEVFARDYKGVIIIDEGLISGITPDLIKKGEVDEALKSYIKDSVFVFLSSDKSHIINNRNLRNKTSKNSGKFYSVDSHVLDDEIEKYNTLQTKIELMGGITHTFYILKENDYELLVEFLNKNINKQHFTI